MASSVVTKFFHLLPLSFLYGPRGYKTFFMLNSTEHEISTAHKKLKYQQTKKFIALSLAYVVFIMLINVKMPTIVGILTLMSRIHFVLSGFEHEKSFITSGPGSKICYASLDFALSSTFFLRRASSMFSIIY